MKINELSFKNKRHRWELEPTTFNDLTLLVGASGVGKTQILKALRRLINISRGYAYNGVEWDIRFTTTDSKKCHWTGAFESIEETEQQKFTEEEISKSSSLKKIPRLLNEKLLMDGAPVFERKDNALKYEGKDVPKISPHKSVLSLFTEEEKVFRIRVAFSLIVFLNQDTEQNRRLTRDKFINISTPVKKALDHMQKSFEKTFAKFNHIVGTKFSSTFVGEPISTKIIFAYFYEKESFEKIVCDFKDIFPQVEDVRAHLLEEEEVYELQIKERGTDWISQHEISSGMFTTLLHMAGMYLIADGSVILIDEFENSLGVNCIDAVAGNIAPPDRNLQYIITSHHPYIINNIDMKHWKLVMRDGAKVFTKSAKDLKLGKSKHEAFVQLINLDEYTVGIS